jgi:hypothetical protein
MAVSTRFGCIILLAICNVLWRSISTLAPEIFYRVLDSGVGIALFLTRVVNLHRLRNPPILPNIPRRNHPSVLVRILSLLLILKHWQFLQWNTELCIRNRGLLQVNSSLSLRSAPSPKRSCRSKA